MSFVAILGLESRDKPMVSCMAFATAEEAEWWAGVLVPRMESLYRTHVTFHGVIRDPAPARFYRDEADVPMSIRLRETTP